MYAVIDIETGGFGKKKNAICEIAILVLDSGFEVVEEYSTLIAPYIRCPSVAEEEGQLVSYKDDAMEVNGIKMEDILKGPSAEYVAKCVYELLYDNSVEVLIGHNLNAFDKPWMEEFMSRFKTEFKFDKTIDTMKLSREKGNAKNSLKDLCEQYKIVNKESHRALSDCFATLELLKILL